MKLKALIKLTRFEHGVMLSFAVLIGYAILGVDFLSLDPYVFISSLLVPLLIEVGAFSLNDYLDYKSDMLNKRRDRPLVSGEIQRDIALYIFVFSFVLAVMASFFLPKPAFYITIAFAFLSIAYDLSLKHLPLIGNIIIALSMGIPFVFANAIISNTLDEVILVIFSMALFMGIAREIVKDIEDVKGDIEAASSKTLPVLLGIKNSAIVASMFLFAFMFVAIIPFIFYFEASQLSLFFLLLSYLFVAYSTGIVVFQIKENSYKLQAARVKKYLLIAMVFGLVSLMLAANSL